MENTIQSAEEFIQWAQHSFENETGEGGTQAEWMVAYAKEVATSASSAPSSIGEDELRNKLSLLKEDGYSLDYQDGFIGCFEWAISHLSNRKIVLPSEEEIKKLFTTEHYTQEDGRQYRVRKDRIQGAKIIIDEIKRLNGIN